MFTIKKAVTEKQKRDAQRIRYKVYVEQDKKFQDKFFPNKRMEIKHDDESDTIILVVYYKEKAIGTISAFAHSPNLGLPIEETIEAIKNEFNLNEFIKKRQFDSKLYSCGMLAIDEDYRGKTNISIWLYRFIFELMKRQGCHDIIATINHKIEKTMKLIGFRSLIDHKWYSEEIGNEIFLMYGEAEQIAKVLELQNIPNWCENEFASSTRIGIYHDEDIIQEGEDSDKLFLILEGSVKVVKRTNNRDELLTTLSQGHTIGEAVLSSGKRTATVKTAYCAVKILLKNEVMSIIKDVHRSKPLIKVLIDRLIKMNNRLLKINEIDKSITGYDIFSKIFPEKFLKNLPVKKLKPNTLLCKLGEKSTTVYGVKKGGIKVTLTQNNGKDLILAKVLPPSLAGYMALFNDECRTANMFTDSKETELYMIEEDIFWEIFETQETRIKLMENLFELISKMNNLISQNQEREEMISNFKNWLLNYFKTKRLEEFIKASEKIEDERPLNLDIRTISQEFGLKLEMVEKLMNQLLKKGIVTEINNAFTLPREKESALEQFIFDF